MALNFASPGVVDIMFTAYDTSTSTFSDDASAGFIYHLQRGLPMTGPGTWTEVEAEFDAFVKHWFHVGFLQVRPPWQCHQPAT